MAKELLPNNLKLISTPTEAEQLVRHINKQLPIGVNAEVYFRAKDAAEEYQIPDYILDRAWGNR